MASKKSSMNSVSYDPKTPIGRLFAKMRSAKGKAVAKATLYKGIGVDAPKLLAWILIHGRTSGLWTVKYSGEKNSMAALVMTKKGTAAFAKAA
jgi:hypothetical protein